MAEPTLSSFFFEVEDEIYLNFRDEAHSFKEMPDVQGVVCQSFIVSAPTLNIYISEISFLNRTW